MIGEKIYKLRKEFNVSQEELAMAINTSRQSVSKWELGDSYPEVNKLKDIASFFNVSTDYLLNYDIENTSCNGFLSRLKSCIDNKNFSITLNEIKSYTLRFNNNFDLFILCADYLLSLEIERNERNLLETIVSYFKKAMSLYNFHTSKDVSIYDINLFIIKTYTLYNKYELAMEYMEETKVYDKVSLAECKYKLKKYKDASIIVSDIYISAISDILSSKHMQIRILLKENKELEAYELTNWVLDFIDTIRKKEALFTDIKITYMYLKLVCEKKLKKDYLNTIKQLKEMVNNVSNDLENTDNIKFYYGENCAFYTTVKAYKERLKEEILEDKDEYFALYSEVFKEVFGGDIDE